MQLKSWKHNEHISTTHGTRYSLRYTLRLKRRHLTWCTCQTLHSNGAISARCPIRRQQ